MNLSVVICTWNRCDSLERTLHSLSALVPPENHDVEVIVVDNNSTDHTREVVTRCQAAWPLGRLRYLFEPVQGKQFALNAGIKAAVGDALLFTDDDILFDADWLQASARALLSSNAALIGGVTRLEWPGAAPVWYNERMSAVTGEVNLGTSAREPAPADYSPAGANFIVRRSTVDAIGPFAETHFRHMDFEYGMRARRAGLILRYDPALVVSTSVPKIAISKRYFRRWYFKLGIAKAMDSDVAGPRFMAVPRWMWRSIIVEGLAAVYRYVRGDQSGFIGELLVWQQLGFVCCRWHRVVARDQHAQWVSRWSQKRNEEFS